MREIFRLFAHKVAAVVGSTLGILPSAHDSAEGTAYFKALKNLLCDCLNGN